MFLSLKYECQKSFLKSDKHKHFLPFYAKKLPAEEANDS